MLSHNGLGTISQRKTKDVAVVPLCGRGWRVVGVKPMAAPVHPHVRGDGGVVVAGMMMIAVHPHVRGDGRQWEHQYIWDYGSPPRAWGRQRRRCNSRTSPAVHPHVRGDGSALRVPRP